MHKITDKQTQGQLLPQSYNHTEHTHAPDPPPILLSLRAKFFYIFIPSVQCSIIFQCNISTLLVQCFYIPIPSVQCFYIPIPSVQCFVLSVILLFRARSVPHISAVFILTQVIIHKLLLSIYLFLYTSNSFFSFSLFS